MHTEFALNDTPINDMSIRVYQLQLQYHLSHLFLRHLRDDFSLTSRVSLKL